MTDQHPITPSPELVQQWLCSDDYLWGPLEQKSITITANRLQNVATLAAQWGADQELEACCHEVQNIYSGGHLLRAARRPKPPNLKEQALALVSRRIGDGFLQMLTDADAEIIRQALEALPND